MKNIDISQIIKDVKTSDFTRNCGMPLGYVAGYPLIKIKNSKPCLVIPFLRYKSTGIVDKTLIYPIRFAITVSLTTGKIVGFEDFGYRSAFRNIDFSKPIGFFRHDAIKDLNKQQYKEKKSELFALFSEIATAIVENKETDATTEQNFSALFSTLLEPSLHSTYKWLDDSFCKRFLK